MAKKFKSLVQVCINPKLKTCIYVDASDLVIGFDEEGNEIKVSDLLTFSFNLEKKLNNLETSHNELVTKYNALLAAYKANAAKTAMQLLENKESN